LITVQVSKFFIAPGDAAIFPPSLTRLGISWECYELSAYRVPEFPKLRDALTARCRELDWIWFDGYYFMFEWRGPMPDGTVKGVSEKDFSTCSGRL
jgi:hypothetical protein